MRLHRKITFSFIYQVYFRIYPKPHTEVNFWGFIYVLFFSGQTIIFHVTASNCSLMKIQKKTQVSPFPC